MNKSMLVVLTAFLSGLLSLLPAANAKEMTGQERAEVAGRDLLGTVAPRLKLKTIDGQEIDLGDLYGKKAVYLEFWATWCIPCREQMPHLKETYETAGPDLAVIALNSGFNDTVDDVKTIRQKMGLAMPIVVDNGEAAAAFNLRVTPQHVVIGRDGRIQYIGHLADEHLDKALRVARMAKSSQFSPAEAKAASPLRQYGIGDQLPALSTKTVEGRTVRLRDLKDRRPIVLVFLSPWCESYLASTRPGLSTGCRQVREQVDSLAKESSQTRWLGVASGLWATEDDLVGYRKQYKTSIPLALDDSGVLFHSFRVMNVPTLLIADADGKIVRRLDGFDTRLPDIVRSLTRTPGNRGG